MPDASDLDLLRIEIETQWVRDDRWRLLREREENGKLAPYLVIACARDAQVVEVGSTVPAALADDLRAIVERTSPQRDPSVPPKALARCASSIRPIFGPVEVSSGPSYWIPPETAFASDVLILRSDSADAESLPETPPDGAHWRDGEWRELLDGALGPWAFAIVGGNVVSICHCARLSERGAEAGVWTHPDHRGRGHAAAVTAAWASVLASKGRTLFYSTSAENVSSQRVAARLRLRPIGWMWRLVPPEGG